MQSYNTQKKMHHYGWDNSINPVLSIVPGEIVEIETIDASGNQLSKNSDDQDLIDLNFEKVNPVTGPIYIEGAKKGDAIAIKFLDFMPNSKGWG